MCPDCGKHYDIGDWPFPCAGLGHTPGPYWTHDAQIHTSEKVTVYENVHTGDVKIPGRSDRPLHPKLAAEGYVRKTLDTPSQIRQLEQKKNLIHERSNYNRNSTQAEKDTGSS
jgi:hypothetical protein